MDSVNFFFEDTPEFSLDHGLLHEWLNHVIESEGQTLHELNYILCSDEYLYNINVEYLNHDYYTDVITFDNSETKDQIEGDIFISIDRVKENAVAASTSLHNELQRIIVHGLLHLLGYNDKTPEEKSAMTEKENAYLSLPQFQLDS